MVDDSELESRAVEELLRETSRARLRTETMGPAGWLKCPLRSTNKRFLINTLRSTITKRASSQRQTASQGLQGEKYLAQTKEGKRTNSTVHKDSEAHEECTDKYKHNDYNNFKYGGCSYKDADQKYQKHLGRKDLEESTIHSLDPSSCEKYSSFRGHSSSGDCSQSQHNACSSNKSLSRHSHYHSPHHSRTHSRSPVSEIHNGRKHK